MHVLTSDDEAPDFDEINCEPTKLQMMRRANLKNKKARKDPIYNKLLRRRAKKIVKKLKCEALSACDIQLPSSNLVELHQLILENKVGDSFLL